jgi:malate:Na+ symporter
MPSPAPTVHPEGIAITTTAHVPGAQARTRRFRPQGWWRLVDIQIGIIPLPVYLILVGLLWVLT